MAIALVGVFLVGFVLVVDAIIGKEIRSEWQGVGFPYHPDDPPPDQPRVRHRWRRALGGLALMVVAGAVIALR